MSNRNLILAFLLALVLASLSGSPLALQQPAAGQEVSKAPATLAELEPVLGQVAAYQYGQDRKPLAIVIDFVRTAQTSGKELPELEKRLGQVLVSAGTQDGKRFVCEQLSLIGSELFSPGPGRNAG